MGMKRWTISLDLYLTTGHTKEHSTSGGQAAQRRQRDSNIGCQGSSQTASKTNTESICGSVNCVRDPVVSAVNVIFTPSSLTWMHYFSFFSIRPSI